MAWDNDAFSFFVISLHIVSIALIDSLMEFL